MTDDIDNIESVAELDRVIALAKFVADARTVELRARALAKLNRHIREGETKLATATAAAEEIKAALAAREAAIAAREAAHEKRETVFESQAQDVRNELREHHARLEQMHRQLVHRIMSTAGILGNWNFDRQGVPSWEQLRRQIVDLPPDLAAPAAEVMQETVTQDWVGHTFVPGSSLTRTVSQ
jgi:hypothetical protein